MVTSMFSSRPMSRRGFMRSVSFAAAGIAIPYRALSQSVFQKNEMPFSSRPLQQFDYGDVEFASGPHDAQLEQTHAVLMGLSDDSLLKPFRQMSGQAAPGDDLGGWYRYDPDYKTGRPDNAGFAPTCTFGQWISALARMYAIRPDQAIREKVLRLNRLYAQTISDDYYENNRFPTYCYDKLVRGLVDSHKYLRDPDAFSILEQTTNTALPHFPKCAVEHDQAWRPNKDATWTWDESYTISENLFIAYECGAGERYHELAWQYLDNNYYDPLAEGRDVLAGRHAYSYVNSLGSAIQAYLTLGSEKHLRAAKNGFDMLLRQSFVTGGWGPDEMLRDPASSDVYASLTNTHASFETPCGSYAHFKLTRNLLRVTRDARYGDSMERVMYNTVLGAKPLMPDGRTYYYSDYNFKGHKIYRPDQHWACCSGTLPQVASDYRINTYFRDPQGVWVNLYIPSTLRWKQDGADVALTQESQYPFESAMHFHVETSRARRFALNFRIPAWTSGASISVNGRRMPEELVPGTFATVQREWKRGDRIELDLPMTTRLEPVDPQHPQTAALVFGPLVLFAITDTQPSLTRADLLAARRTGQRTWQAGTSTTPLKLLPFTEIQEEQYSTYLNVT
jgi:uncharacterized protein